MSNDKQWQFHFRNFSQDTVDFATHHFGCGGAPWHDGRARCNHLKVGHNPTGGGNSVYVPSSFIVDETQWVSLILDSIQLALDVAASIADEGESLPSVISDSLSVDSDIINAAIQDTGKQLDTLTKDAVTSFAASCRAVGKSPEQIRAIAGQMGLGPKSFTFIAGDAYQQYIRKDNPDTNDDNGWSLFADNGTRRIATAAFIHQAHLILYFNPNDLNGFWAEHW